MPRASNVAGVLSGLGLDLRYAVRALARSPGFTAVAVATLALGIGASTAMFSVVHAVMGRALPFPEPDRLVMGRATFDGAVGPLVSLPNYVDYRDRSASLQSLAAFGSGAFLATVSGKGEPEEASIIEVTANFFETLGVEPLLGGTFTIDERPAAGGGQVVISHRFWQRWFGGDPDVLGRSLAVKGDRFRVMGVMTPGFRFLWGVDLWIPPWPGSSEPVHRRYTNWLTVGRLASGVSLEAAQAELDVIAAQLQDAYPDSNQGRALKIDGLRTVMVEDCRQDLLVVGSAVVLILLIACGNVASLLMARGSARTAELAVRAALGAGRSRLTLQLLVECALLAVMAGCLGIVLAVWLQEGIKACIPLDLLGLGEVGVSFTMLGIGVTLSVATVLIFGALPSLAAARANPAEDLRQSSRGSGVRGGVRYRSGLVVLQVGISLVLLVWSGLLIRSFARLHGVDPGFTVQDVLTATISLPSDGYPDGEHKLRFFQRLKERIEGLPGVESVAVVNRLPVLHPWANYRIWHPERPPELGTAALTADRRLVLPGYFATMGIPLLEGRVLDEGDVAGSLPAVVLTRTAAELVYPGESALGRRVVVDMGNRTPATFEVVGIVEDHQLTSLTRASMRPAMFFSYAQVQEKTMRLAVATSVEPESLVRPIQERVWELDRDIVLSRALTMEDALSGSIADHRSIATALTVFAVVAVGLAILGLYGVLAFSLTRRTREIGIRVALGATHARVLRLIVQQGMKLVGVGTVLGIFGAAVSTRLLRGMLFEISAADPLTHAAVVGLLVVVGAGASLLPALRVLRIDPMGALRAE